MLSASLPPHSQTTKRERDKCGHLPVVYSSSYQSVLRHFAHQVVAITLKLLQGDSLKPYLPCVQRGLMKCPADISMATLTHCLTKLLTPQEQQPKHQTC